MYENTRRHYRVAQRDIYEDPYDNEKFFQHYYCVGTSDTFFRMEYTLVSYNIWKGCVFFG